MVIHRFLVLSPMLSILFLSKLRNFLTFMNQTIWYFVVLYPGRNSSRSWLDYLISLPRSRGSILLLCGRLPAWYHLTSIQVIHNGARIKNLFCFNQSQLPVPTTKPTVTTYVALMYRSASGLFPAAIAFEIAMYMVPFFLDSKRYSWIFLHF